MVNGCQSVLREAALDLELMCIIIQRKGPFLFLGEKGRNARWVLSYLFMGVAELVLQDGLPVS